MNLPKLILVGGGLYKQADGRHVEEITERDFPEIARRCNMWDEMVEKLKALQEYWNGEHDEGSMSDALDHQEDVLADLLARATEEQKEK